VQSLKQQIGIEEFRAFGFSQVVILKPKCIMYIHILAFQEATDMYLKIYTNVKISAKSLPTVHGRNFNK
jgi:hypothetical protein